MPAYSKPFLSVEEQIQRLKSRGLEITDEATAAAILQRTGYYRLSAYWFPFRQASSAQNHLQEERFIPGSCFQDAVALYVYDKKLRLLLLDAIERIEISVRVSIAHHLGQIDTFAYENTLLLRNEFTKPVNTQTTKPNHLAWLNKYHLLENKSQEEFIRHFRQKYDSHLPIWIAIELWDFGLLSTFYYGMRIRDKKIIASQYHIPDWTLLESWLRTLNFVRNVAAHHCRLWNRNIVNRPKLPFWGQMTEFDTLTYNRQSIQRLYGVLSILLYLIKEIHPNSQWPERLKQLILDFPATQTVNIKHMGFPTEWETEPLWNIEYPS